MKLAGSSPFFAIGWDVGGWNCDRNPSSRDAIVILDSSRSLVGQPWRGNLRRTICTASTTRDWIAALFNLCKAEAPVQASPVTVAIDTPLGFSEEFLGLVTRQAWTDPADESGNNRYLFRHTERHLFARGKSPLSPVKDMIGSQATKGMHVLSKFAPRIESCGVWTDGAGFRVIEVYPAACDERFRRAPLEDAETLGHSDKDDARIGAAIAHLFATDRSQFEPPDAKVPLREGWIWAPRLLDSKLRRKCR